MEYAIHIGFKTTNNETKYEILLAELRVTIELRVESLNAFMNIPLEFLPNPSIRSSKSFVKKKPV